MIEQLRCWQSQAAWWAASIAGAVMSVWVWMPVHVFAAVDPEQSMDLPRDISLHGHHLDDELYFITWTITIIFVLCGGWMAYALLFHNKNHKAKYDHGNSWVSIMLVLGMTVGIFVLVDGTGFVNAVEYLNHSFWNEEFHDRELHPEATRIQVNGRQWAWQIRYEGKDGEFATADDIVETNIVRVPVDTPVAIQLTSSDVIHAFSLPNVRIKADAVPGQVAKFWFQIDGERLKAANSTEFDLICQQHCGTHHYKMKGKLIVMEKDAYQRWYQEASIQSELDYDPGPTEMDIAKAAEDLIKDKAKAVKKGQPEPYSSLASWEPKYGPHWGWNWDLANQSKTYMSRRGHGAHDHHHEGGHGHHGQAAEDAHHPEHGSDEGHQADH